MQRSSSAQLDKRVGNMRSTESKKKDGRRRRLLGRAIVAALAIGGMTSTGHAASPYFFSWSNANADTSNTAGSIASSPVLSDQTASTVASQLAYSAAHGFPLAVIINQPLQPGGPAVQLLNSVNNGAGVQYIFLDLEPSKVASTSGKVATEVSTVVSQVQATNSKSAYIGNFNYYPSQNTDPTSSSPPAVSEYEATAGLNMTNEQLYPGSPDYRTPGAAGTNTKLANGGSTAPNIRSALFTLPIERLTLVTNSLYGQGASLSNYTYNASTDRYDPSFDPTGHTKSGLNIPWVTRFNNYGNPALTNVAGTKQTPFIFNGQTNPNDPNPADGQLPSRGDFSAQVAQYRMRGADSLSMFLASVTDQYKNAYTESMQESDMQNGWNYTNSNGSAITKNGVNATTITQSIFAGKYGFANLTDLIRLDNSAGKAMAPTHAEAAGIIWSGVYGEAATGKPTLGSTGVAASTMSIILSNMSSSSATVDLGNVAGYSVYDPASPALDKSGFNVMAGQHLMLIFSLKMVGSSPVWDLSTNNIVFTDNNRFGTGTPEPASLGILGIGALGLLARRRRRHGVSALSPL